jgi:hypothetical protein
MLRRRKTSLASLPKKKIDAGIAKLQKLARIDSDRWFALLAADEPAMARIDAAWPQLHPSFSYDVDAVAILGFGNPSEESLPDAKSGEMVIRYGGWSLQELRDNPVVRKRKLMWKQDWYHTYPWSTEKLPSGIYRLRIPVPNSNRQTFAEQQSSLPSGEAPAPVVLVATALLAHRVQTGEDLLKNDWTRCKEQTADAVCVVLYWYDGRLFVNDYWHDNRSAYSWLSSVRTS